MTDLRTRIAAVIRREVPCHPPAADRIADAVIRELDTVLLDFGVWLSEEITGSPISRIDLESCLTDWKADE
jgi:hypothetical protein